MFGGPSASASCRTIRCEWPYDPQPSAGFRSDPFEWLNSATSSKSVKVSAKLSPSCVLRCDHCVLRQKKAPDQSEKKTNVKQVIVFVGISWNLQVRVFIFVYKYIIMQSSIVLGCFRYAVSSHSSMAYLPVHWGCWREVKCIAIRLLLHTWRVSWLLLCSWLLFCTVCVHFCTPWMIHGLSWTLLQGDAQPRHTWNPQQSRGETQRSGHSPASVVELTFSWLIKAVKANHN